MGSYLKPGKLIQHSSKLYSTHHTYYGKKSRALTRQYAPRLVKDLEKIDQELELTNYRMILRPLKNQYNGLTFTSHNITYIDPMRKSYGEVLRTVVHECLHLKQIQDKRLKWDRKKMALIWEGKSYPVSGLVYFDLTKDLTAYNNFPWEMDVVSKEGELYTKITGKELPKINTKVGTK